VTDWGKILVGTRLEKTVSSRFFQVWTDLVLHGLRTGDSSVSVRGQVAHKASNALVRLLLDSDCDTLFMLDSDADIEPDFLARFRDYEPGFDYDILQAFYTRRGWPPRAIWMRNNALGDMMEYFVTDPDTIEDLDIAGTHCVFIRRQVFEGMVLGSDPKKHEWFFYPRHKEESEDGAFSKEAKKKGYRIGGTTHVKAGHISELTTGWDIYLHYLDTTGRLPLIDRYRELSGLVSQFTGEDQNLVVAKAAKGNETVKDAWEWAKPTGVDSVADFYGSDDNGYLYELLNWNCQPNYESMTAPLKEVEDQRVLIIGAGLGGEYQNLKDKNEVDVFELPGVFRRFLKFRFPDINILPADRVYRLQGKYDLIVALDVLEHVHPDEIGPTLDAIGLLLAPNGQLYAHNNFGEFDKYPMHFDHSKVFDSWSSQFERLGDMAWVKR